MEDSKRTLNVAALREALEVLLEDVGPYCDDSLVVLWGPLKGATIRKAKEALSSPPRNCDRFTYVQDAEDAFEKEVLGLHSKTASEWDKGVRDHWRDFRTWLFQEFDILPRLKPVGFLAQIKISCLTPFTSTLNL